jgi:translocation and assembly module TamB
VDEQHTYPDEHEAGEPIVRRSWLRVILHVIWISLAAFVLTILLALLLLQTNWGAQTGTRIVLGLVDPLSDAVIRVEQTRGTFLTSLDLRGVQIVHKDSIRGERELVRIDTLQARYSLLGILGRRLSVKEFRIVNPQVRMHQLADGSWDLINAMPFPEEVDTAATAFLLDMRNIAVLNGNLAMHYYPQERDSVMYFDDVNGLASELHIGEDVSIALDTLWLAMRPPGGHQPLFASASGSLFNDNLHLNGLQLTSDLTDLFARGSLVLPGSDRHYIEDIDFELTANPIAFRDIRPFLPTLDPDRLLWAEATVGGSTALLRPDIVARTDDGASFALSGEIGTGIDGPVAYRLSGEVRRLDPAIFTGAERGNVLLSANLRTDLEGTTLQELDGFLFAEVFNSRFGEFAPDRTVLDAQFANGRANVDVRGGLRGATISARGTIRPFDDVIPYNFRGQMANLDFYRFTDGEGTSNLTGNFRIEGRGFDPQTSQIDVELALVRSQINDFVIESGTADFRIADGAGRGSVRAMLPEGFIAATGEVDFGDPMTYAVSRGRMENLDLAALTGADGPSSLTGSFSLRGRGTDPQTMSLSGRFDLDRSVYDQVRIQNAGASFTLANGALRFDGLADLDGGSFDLAGVIRPFETVQPYQITRGRFFNLDIGVLTGRPDQSSDLTGTISGSGRGFDPQRMIADARLDLAPSTLNQQEITEASLVVAVRRGDVRLDGDMIFPEGRIQLIASAQPFLDRPTYEIEQGYVAGLDLGALTNNPELSSILHGSVRLRGEGLEPQTMRLVAAVDLDQSRINQVHIIDGQLSVNIANGFTQFGTELNLADGFLRADGRGRLFDPTPVYEARGQFLNVNLAGLALADTVSSSLSGSFELEGRGFDPETMRLEGHLRASDSRYEDVEVSELHADILLFDGLLQVDQLRVRSNVGLIDGSGQLALFDPEGRYESDFRFRADVQELAPIRPLIGAQVLDLEMARIDARVYGPPGQVRFDAAGEARSFVYNDIRVAGFRGEIAGELEPGLRVRVAESVGEVDYFSTGDISLQATTYSIAYDDQDLVFDIESVVDGRRDLSIAGRIDLRPEAQIATIDRLNIRLDRDRWQMLDEATIAYGEEIRISNFLIFSGQQQIAIDGVINPRGNQNLIMTIEDFRIDAVADLLGYRGLGGEITGFLDLTGPAEAPRMAGLLDAEITADGRYVGDMQLTLDYDALRLNIDALLTHEDGSSLILDGYVPMDLRLVAADAEGARPGVALEAGEGPALGDVNLVMRSNNFAVNWVMPFLDRDVTERLDGRLDGEMTILGTFENPLLDGELTLSNGTVRLPQLDIVVRDMQVNALLVDNRIDILRAFARSGDGTLTGSGSIHLEQLTLGQWDLAFTTNRFLAIDNREYRFVVNSDLRLGGTTLEPILSGNVQVITGDIWLTDQTTGTAAPVALTEADLRMLEQRFGYRATEADTAAFDFYEALDMNLSLSLERNTWLRSRGNPNMDVQFTGNLDVTKRPNEEMNVFGNIDVIPERSRIRQFGRSFDITSGTLQFNGPIEESLVDFDAEYRVRARASAEDQVTIVLGVSGRLDSLELELYSRDPPGLDMADIVSYIAVGRPASEGFLLGGGPPGGELQRLTTTAVLDQVAGWVEGVAGDELGLDVIEIEQDGLRGTMITAGKYVTRRLFVAVSEPITRGGDAAMQSDFRQAYDRRILIEYEVSNWLLSRFVREGENVRVMLLWEYSY